MNILKESAGPTLSNTPRKLLKSRCLTNFALAPKGRNPEPQTYKPEARNLWVRGVAVQAV